ncbi:hypothetical protein XENTR_v10015100 [Xenopus tropicalis]|uniref:Cytochrome P450 2K6 n=1 Tax=Xenopus tropicalis TaxID=8364 RepID=A0A8J1JPC9_XENTR|nr:cytochrome P450 2K6 [Xenopus tropicalis]XP_031758890.1 cytochrome P450 2K6 [Xenopus tropicalis]KAE8605388.1 hypothetical protein XENTR_v10015100 [Xenopus tropicalis]
MDPVSVLLSVVVCIFLFKVFYGGKRTLENFPPGPKPLPLIGNLHMMNMKKPHLTFMELAEKYGSVFSVHLGTEKVVVLCGTDTVRDALINHAEEFSERAKMPIFEDFSKGLGVVFGHGENWKVMRRFTLSTLRDFGMGKKTIEERISEESDCLVETIKSYEGKPFDNTLIMNAAVANIIVHILLNHRFDYQDPTLLKLINIVIDNIKIGGSPIVMLYNTYPSVVRWIPGSHKTLGENTAQLYKFLEETFTQHREQLDVNDQRDLIDAFLVKQQEEKPSSAKFFHNENLVALLANLFVAGMETSSTTLRWGLLLMMKYPDIQKKVQDEIDRVIGSVEPRLEHRKLMPYTDAVIHEIQRFANIAPISLPHATTTDVTFRGYFIPKDTQVMIVLTSVLRDKDYFKKPEDFYPEHFLNSKGNFVKNEAFLPFSAGRRICAGETLAKMELFLFFTKLLQNFTFQPPPGVEVDLTCADAMTSKPQEHQICALPRG